MTKITSYQDIYKTHIDTKPTEKKHEKTFNNSTLLTALKSIISSCIKLKKSSFDSSPQNKDVSRDNAFQNRARGQVIDSKTMRDFISQKLTELNLAGAGKDDPVYASQACDAVLASIYSNKKDAFCKEMISKGINTTGYLKEAGEAAKKVGLKGEMYNNVFVPSGAGANPFVTPLISSAQQKFPHMFSNKTQQASFKQYAEKKISYEVEKICKDKGMISPAEFGVMLEKIARKHLAS